MVAGSTPASQIDLRCQLRHAILDAEFLCWKPAGGASRSLVVSAPPVLEDAMDFYAVLGITSNADEVAIRSAYRVLARRYHPDSGTGANLEKFHEVADAYETLIDPSRRRAYDLWLQRDAETKAFQQHEPVNPFGLLEELIRFIKKEALLLLRRSQPKQDKTTH